jgi:hypothetical protein
LYWYIASLMIALPAAIQSVQIGGTGCIVPRLRRASMAIPIAEAPMRTATLSAAIDSARLWPYGCSASGGRWATPSA